MIRPNGADNELDVMGDSLSCYLHGYKGY